MSLLFTATRVIPFGGTKNELDEGHRLAGISIPDSDMSGLWLKIPCPQAHRPF